MKPLSRILKLCFLITLVLMSEAKSQVSRYVVNLHPINPSSGDYVITILDQSFGAYLRMSLDGVGHLRPTEGTIGMAHIWYETNLNTIFDFNYVITHQDFYGITVPSTQVIETPLNVPFYLSYWFELNPNSPANPGGSYGWAKLLRNETEMVLVDHYIAPDRKGIIVGTTTAVPEPSTYALMGLGLAVVFLVSRRR